MHWNIVFTFSLVAFTAVLSERLGSTDGASLSDNHINLNQNRKDDIFSSPKNSGTDEESDEVFVPVQPMNFDDYEDPFDPMNPNSINNPFNPLNPNGINSPLNPLNQSNPASPYYQGDDLLDPSNPLNYENPLSPLYQNYSGIDAYSDSSSQDLFSGDSFGDGLGSGFDDSFSSGFGSGFDDHF